MFISMVNRLEDLALHYPDKLALVCEEQRQTYFEFNQRVNQWANALIEMGIKKGDKVAILNTNSIESLQASYGVTKTGCVVVPLNPMVQGEALKAIINDSDSVALICGEAFSSEIHRLKHGLTKIPEDRYISIGEEKIPGFASSVHILDNYSRENPRVEISPEDISSIIYSSGTTGLPKGVVLTHDFRCAFCMYGCVEFLINFHSVILNSTPIYHNGSLLFVQSALFSGGAVVMMKKFDPEGFLKLVQKELVTHAFLVPTQYVTILELESFSSYNTGSLEVLLCMAAPLSAETKEKILSNFECRLFEAYGLTEAGAGALLKPRDQQRKIGSVGKPNWSEIRLVDEDLKDVAVGEVGEIVGRSSMQMREYYKKPELTRETVVDGWVRTGDLGRFDEEGYLYLVGRKKDMIISGGVNIFPEDIEKVMLGHPKIKEVAVFGVPHEKWGETPRAAVVISPGKTATPEEITEWTNARVASYQKIKNVDILTALPRNPTGKVLKRELRAPFWKRA